MFTIAQINTAIELMVKTQDKMSKAVAQVIVMALWGANSEKSPDVANTLVKNIRKGIRKQAVIDLLQAHGNLAYVSGTFVTFEAAKGWTDEEVEVYKAAAINWETFKKPVVADKEVDALEAIEALIATLTKKDEAKHLVNAGVLTELRAFYGKVAGEALVG